MNFETFFPILGMSAMTVVAALLAWTVKQVLTLTTDVAALSVTVASIKDENEACAADRAAQATSVAKLIEGQATLTERSYHHTKMLEDIKAAVTKRPAPARPKASK